jgi:hypothetical protein
MLSGSPGSAAGALAPALELDRFWIDRFDIPRLSRALAALQDERRRARLRPEADAARLEDELAQLAEEEQSNRKLLAQLDQELPRALSLLAGERERLATANADVKSRASAAVDAKARAGLMEKAGTEAERELRLATAAGEAEVERELAAEQAVKRARSSLRMRASRHKQQMHSTAVLIEQAREDYLRERTVARDGAAKRAQDENRVRNELERARQVLAEAVQDRKTKVSEERRSREELSYIRTEIETHNSRIQLLLAPAATTAVS